MASMLYPLSKIGSEFMPPLYEGDILYMPTTFPGISITKAKEVLQQTDKILKTFPEVRLMSARSAGRNRNRRGSADDGGNRRATKTPSAMARSGQNHPATDG